MDDSTSELEFGKLITEAGANGNLTKLKVMRKRVALQFQEICNEYRDFSGKNVLHHAAEIGHLEICKFLIKNVQVYINASSYWTSGDTPLLLATKGGNAKLVKYLISEGAEVQRANSKGFTALHYAVLQDNRELMEFLLQQGARVNADSVAGSSLQCAASHGNVKAVRFLLSHGAKPTYCFLLWESPLVCAIKAHSIECMDVLIKGKADPNIFYFRFSPLSYTAKEGDTKYLNFLLGAGADPNEESIGLLKPIEDAALVHNCDDVEILFPLIKQCDDFPEWSVDGIMEYCHSEEAKKQTERRRNELLARVDEKGQTAVMERNYSHAVVRFGVAQNLDPSNPKWASKRSLCHAHLGRLLHCLLEVKECIRLNVHRPNHRDGESEKFHMAGLAFMLHPYDVGTFEAFRLAFFDHFASLYLMSSQEEIDGFTPEQSSPLIV